MNDLRSRLLRACNLGSGGVTGVTLVTRRSVTAKKPSRYNGYRGYSAKAFDPPSTGSESPHDVTGTGSRTWDKVDWQAYFHERAAVREYAGGLDRGDAEVLAFEDTVTQWLCLHPVSASRPQDGCISCGSDEHASDTLLPILAPGGNAWIHDGCWQRWREDRRRQARMALEHLGIRPPAPSSDRTVP